MREAERNSDWIAELFRLETRRTVGPQDQSSPPAGSKIPARARTIAEGLPRESVRIASRLMGGAREGIAEARIIAKRISRPVVLPP
jgi:hypothetical protein